MMKFKGRSSLKEDRIIWKNEMFYTWLKKIDWIEDEEKLKAEPFSEGTSMLKLK